MYPKKNYKYWLMRRLEKKGMGKGSIPGFIWSLKSCILVNPDLDHVQLNSRLHLLGWDDVELDYHTFQLAMACFETKNTNRTVWPAGITRHNPVIS